MYIIAQPRPLPQGNAFSRFIAGRSVPVTATAVRVAPAGQVRR